MGKTILREPCKQCNSSNNLITFIATDGSTKKKCMTPNCDNKEYVPTIEKPQDITGEYLAILDRGLSKKTCEIIGIKCGKIYDQECHIYEYANNSLKIRLLPKEFTWLNKNTKSGLFGLDKFKNYSLPIIITEGEIDAASFIEAANVQACSLSSGASSVKKEILENKDELLKYTYIVLAFDNDSAGQEAIKQALEILPIEQVRLINFGQYKDANSVLLKDSLLLYKMFTEAQEYIPEGVTFGRTLVLDDLLTSPPKGIELPYPKLNETIKGLQRGMLYLLGAGSSIGKSSVLRELVYFLRTQNPDLKIANLFLEETQEISPLSYIAIHNNVPIGELMIDRTILSMDEWQTSFDKLLNTDNMMFTNAQYNLNSTQLLQSLEYLAKSKKYDVVVLDHISLVISGSNLSRAGERRDIDELMHNLSALVKKTGLIVIAACHLSNPDKGKSWDEGREVGIYDLKGSSGLAQKPDVILGIERNMKDPYSCDILKIRVLKNRWFSILGEVDNLVYYTKSGRLGLKGS